MTATSVEPIPTTQHGAVVSASSSTSPGRNKVPVIQSIAWSGPATNPSRDIVKCRSTLPAAVCRSVSAIRLYSTGTPRVHQVDDA